MQRERNNHFNFNSRYQHWTEIIFQGHDWIRIIYYDYFTAFIAVMLQWCCSEVEAYKQDTTHLSYLKHVETVLYMLWPTSSASPQSNCRIHTSPRGIVFTKDLHTYNTAHIYMNTDKCATVLSLGYTTNWCQIEYEQCIYSMCSVVIDQCSAPPLTLVCFWPCLE